jgi:Asp/Glu/hydantoin racemase
MNDASSDTRFATRFVPRHKAVHGITIGVLVLDTGFQRIPGDIAHAGTWPFPVHYAVVRGATSRRVVQRVIDEEVVELFLRACDDLVALGVDGITTSCGFLALLHPRLVAHCPVPVATSSLLQIPLVQSVLPKGRRVGVVTMNKDALSPAHFAAVGAPTDLPVAGIPEDSVFRQHQLTNQLVADPRAHERIVLEATGALLAEHPDIGALVFECTNLPTFSATVEETFGVPVYDIVSLVEWFHAGLKPRRYGI